MSIKAKFFLLLLALTAFLLLKKKEEAHQQGLQPVTSRASEVKSKKNQPLTVATLVAKKGSESHAVAPLVLETSTPDILDLKTPMDQRGFALQRLIAQGLRALPALTRVISAPVPLFAELENPHSVNNARDRFERGLKITALEQLDRLASQNTAEVRRNLVTILNTQKDPQILFLAQISLLGIQQGRPGKLGRFIEALLDQGAKI